MVESDEQRRLLEGVMLAEEEAKHEFTASTQYLNDYGPQAHLQIENLAHRAEYHKQSGGLASKFLSEAVSARVRGFRMALIATRSREGRFIDVVTIQRSKFAVQSPQEAAGLANKLKMMGPQPQQQQASMF